MVLTMECHRFAGTDKKRSDSIIWIRYVVLELDLSLDAFLERMNP